MWLHAEHRVALSPEAKLAVKHWCYLQLGSPLCVSHCRAKRQVIEAQQEGGRKSPATNSPILCWTLVTLRQHLSELAYFCFVELTQENPSYDGGGESSQSIRFPLIGTRGWGMSDRELQWIFKSWLAVFLCFFSLSDWLASRAWCQTCTRKCKAQ